MPLPSISPIHLKGIEGCGVVASQNRHSCQLADKQAERGYYNERNVVLCVK